MTEGEAGRLSFAQERFWLLDRLQPSASGRRNLDALLSAMIADPDTPILTFELASRAAGAAPAARGRRPQTKSVRGRSKSGGAVTRPRT